MSLCVLLLFLEAGADCRLSAPLNPEHRKALVEALATWNFEPHQLDEGDLYRLATLMFEAALSIEGVAELGIQRGKSSPRQPAPGVKLTLSRPDESPALCYSSNLSRP